ncbi:hypothetical protein ITX31_10105 [Arthrobacter gandavensis]|uniref:hypothetical protein n=1 Tax=Arthrobacter gandavensis TaxID=169960 RepID=UPI00188E07FB|nr:hypothetical protein [Arthrobacter gandavensis]MBF4994464.1 hypothetical protein [Arthrobacter gandavensis]
MLGADSRPPFPGGLTLLLGAAAHLSSEATRLFLADLSLSEHSVRVLQALTAPGMPAARVAILTRLSLEEASFALASLHQAGYARPRRPGRWSRTPSGAAMVEELAAVKKKCDARAGETELRQALYTLIRSMEDEETPDPV